MATFDFAALKARTRQIVHDTMATDAEYTHPHLVGAVGLRIRWHNKIAQYGDLLDTGYAEVVEGINRVIFNRPELDEKSVTLKAGGYIRLLAPQYGGALLILDVQEPVVGPVELVWKVRHDR